MVEYYPDSGIPIIDNVMLTECTGINIGQLVTVFDLPQRVQLPCRSPFFGYRMIFQSAIIDFTSSLNAFSSVHRIIIPLYLYPNESIDVFLVGVSHLHGATVNLNPPSQRVRSVHHQR
jgi:hypothetical protein